MEAQISPTLLHIISMIAYNCTYKKNSYIIAHIKKKYKSDMLQEVIGNKIDILLISGTNLFRLDITQHV